MSIRPPSAEPRHRMVGWLCTSGSFAVGGWDTAARVRSNEPIVATASLTRTNSFSRLPRVGAPEHRNAKTCGSRSGDARCVLGCGNRDTCRMGSHGRTVGLPGHEPGRDTSLPPPITATIRSVLLTSAGVAQPPANATESHQGFATRREHADQAPSAIGAKAVTVLNRREVALAGPIGRPLLFGTSPAGYTTV